MWLLNCCKDGLEAEQLQTLHILRFARFTKTKPQMFVGIALHAGPVTLAAHLNGRLEEAGQMDVIEVEHDGAVFEHVRRNRPSHRRGPGFALQHGACSAAVAICWARVRADIG